MLKLVTLSILADNSKAPLSISFGILCEHLYALKKQYIMHSLEPHCEKYLARLYSHNFYSLILPFVILRGVKISNSVKL